MMKRTTNYHTFLGGLVLLAVLMIALLLFVVVAQARFRRIDEPSIEPIAACTNSIEFGFGLDSGADQGGVRVLWESDQAPSSIEVTATIRISNTGQVVATSTFTADIIKPDPLTIIVEVNPDPLIDPQVVEYYWARTAMESDDPNYVSGPLPHNGNVVITWGEHVPVGSQLQVEVSTSYTSTGSFNPEQLLFLPTAYPDFGTFTEIEEFVAQQCRARTFLPYVQMGAALPPPVNWLEIGASSASGGGISNNTGSSLYPSLAIAPDGTSYVAWYDDGAGNREIYVRHWTGSMWAEVGAGSASGGGISNNGGLSDAPLLAIAPDGTPYVAWRDNSDGDSEIYVRHWTGSTWAEVGAGSASGGGISDNSGDSHWPALAVAPDGTPYVAWQDDSGGDREIYIRRWNGSTWAEVGSSSASGGGISDNSGVSGYPSLAIASDGTPYVAWHDDGAGNREIYVRHWTGSTWTEVGAGSASGGGISNNSGNSDTASLAIAPDGTLYVAWEDISSGDDEIYVRRWSGTTWAEVGTGSASGGGISNNSLKSSSPSLAIAPDGAPTIAWQDDSGGDSEIYVRRWADGTWGEVGAGSASGGGISNNSGGSYLPSLAIAPGGTPEVAWQDDSSGDYEIYIRRHDTQ